MAIGNALNISLTGIKTTQQQLEVTSSNIANADSTGYSRRVMTTTARTTDTRTFGVHAETVTREINTQVQKQWRSATAASAYAKVRLDSLTALDSYFGGPSDSSSLSSVYGAFTDAMQALATTPDSSTNRITAASAADSLASRFRSLSSDIQSLRQEAETNIADSVDRANTLLQTIADLDKQVVSIKSSGASTAGVEDQRDAAVDELASLMDIQVQNQAYGAITISTTNGTLLYDDTPVTLSFDEHGVVGADDQYSTNDDERGVGTLTINGGPGKGVDLFKTGALRSGKIAAYKELRDDTLVQAQSQLDALAAQMSMAVSNRNDTGTYVEDGTAKGYDLDISNLTEGNSISVQYSDDTGDHTVTFVAHDGSATIGDDFTADPDDTVYGIDLSGDVISQIQTALGGSFSVSDQGDDVMRILDDGSGAISIDRIQGSITADGLQSGSTALPLFLDGATDKPYTGLSGDSVNATGLASRIVINPEVTADPAYLVDYAADTQSGDASRPQAVLDALSSQTYYFSPDTGIGSASAPYSGTVEDFLGQVVTSQGAQQETAQQLYDGQEVVTSNLQERYDDSRKVDMDTELASLIQLQTAYSANARVMTVAREMLDTLMGVFN